MLLRTGLSRAAHSTLWSASLLFLLPWFVSASVAFNPVLVADINPAGDSFPDFLTPAGDSVYFYADTGQVKQLFIANDQGVTQLTSLPEGTGCFWPEDEREWPIAVADVTYFGVSTGNSCTASQVWRTDGTPAGTRLVTAREFASIYAAGAGFYLLSGDGRGGMGIWYSDGSESGTRLLEGGFGGDGALYMLGVRDGKLYFVATPPESSRFDFWQADPTGASLLLTNTTLRGYVSGAVYQGAVYAAGEGGEVWRLSAGSDTPVLWQDGSAFYGSVVQMHVIGDRLYLIDIDRSRPLPDWTETLWRFDGAAGNLDEIITYSNITAIAGLGEAVYFAAETWPRPANAGTVLLRLPTTSTTPTAVSPQFAIESGKRIDQMAIDGDFLYMRVAPEEGWELWASDGSAVGTERVTSITASHDGWNTVTCPCLAVAGGQVYFDRKDPATGIELWTLERTAGKSLYLPHLAH